MKPGPPVPDLPQPVKARPSKGKILDYLGFFVAAGACVICLLFIHIILSPRFWSLLDRFDSEELGAPLRLMIGLYMAADEAVAFFPANFYLVAPVAIALFVLLEAKVAAWRRIRGGCFKALTWGLVAWTIYMLLLLSTVTMTFVPLLQKVEGPTPSPVEEAS